MDRPDLSPDLVHFVRGDSAIETFHTLQQILYERRLVGGTGFIRGGFRCVCFCEAPIVHVAEAMAKRALTGIRYQPFGIVVPKAWAFDRGARPAIYQPDTEYATLPTSLRWRHVRYEPTAHPPVDFTWEREWRILADELPLDPDVVTVVLPTRDFAEELIFQHNRNQDYYVMQLEQIFDEQIAGMYREEFPWSVMTIDALGVVV